MCIIVEDKEKVIKVRLTNIYKKASRHPDKASRHYSNALIFFDATVYKK